DVMRLAPGLVTFLLDLAELADEAVVGADHGARHLADLGERRRVAGRRSMVVGRQIGHATDGFAVCLDVWRPGHRIFLAGVLGGDDALLGGATGLGAGGLGIVGLVFLRDRLAADLDGAGAVVGVGIHAEGRIRHGHAGRRRGILRRGEANVGKRGYDLVGLSLAR